MESTIGTPVPWWRRYSRAALVGFAMAAMVQLASAGIEHRYLSPHGEPGLDYLQILIQLPLLLALPGLPIFIVIFMIVRRSRNLGRHLLAWWVGSLVALYSLGWVQHREFRHGFERLASNSRPLVHAIDRYASEHGTPPESLEVLVPRYLPRIPQTGMGPYPKYEYHVFPESERLAKYIWYDLGSRHGVKRKGLVLYTEGDFGHGLLVCDFNPSDSLLRSTFDRMPIGLGLDSFERERWNHRRDERLAMTRGVRDTLEHVKSYRDVIALLGQPDGSRRQVTAGWELSVLCGRGPLNFDQFFYWPDQKYPDQIYSGYVEKVADWAYVHE